MSNVHRTHGQAPRGDRSLLLRAQLLTLIGVAGELAAQEAKGPGSFAVAILDVLNALDGVTVVKHARVN